MPTTSLFSHFHNLHFIKSQTFRDPEYSAGDLQDIFDGGYIVVSLSPEEIIDALCDGELLGTMDVTQEQVEKVYSSLLHGTQNIMYQEYDGEVQP
ncbi:hypothetical protein MTBBW1_2720005 [Desulfamplus magnetovallimortis]|uniref:Uncharacterized protein n=1 Tax=Desulfamplus magnetovallimortis TaxID=1246637 RepID=A0A1W1HFF0_9BACT|nr:hypothetical protein [Desulfamplus magnetovallimortis]SLM31128.1 hypothetical protein MTBBW1_2720005 [Desulfamplus magnetovallimortis]